MNNLYSQDKVQAFEVSCEIVRPANTTAYAINDIINANAATTFPILDFSSYGVNDSRSVQINSINILSSNGAAATKLNAIVYLFNANTLTTQSLVDNAIFNPTFAEVKNKLATAFDSVYNMISSGTVYGIFQTEILRNATLDDTGKIYFAIIPTNAYVPASGETFKLIIKGYLL